MFRKHSSKKEKTLWTEYPDYNPINNVQERPLFDETKVSDEHKVIGQIIRENWELIHPLAQDYLLSSAREWREMLKNVQSAQNTENTQEIIQSMRENFEQKMSKLTIEKDAEIEKVKMEIAEQYKQQLQEKNKEIEHYKMLAESVKSSYDEKTIDRSNLQSVLLEKDKRIAALERLTEELRNKCKSQEIEAMNVQSGISKNFQQQINEITNELYQRQDQIDKLREILAKAKNQLIQLKEKNGELILANKNLQSKVNQLELALEEKEKKLRQVVKTIENFE